MALGSAVSYGTRLLGSGSASGFCVSLISSLQAVCLLLGVITMLNTGGGETPTDKEDNANESVDGANQTKIIYVTPKKKHFSLLDEHSPSGASIKSDRENLFTTASPYHSRNKRDVMHLHNMVVCATGCNPLSYKGYGCYCGFLGSGITVDGIDNGLSSVFLFHFKNTIWDKINSAIQLRHKLICCSR